VGVTEESKFQSREELLAGVLTVFLIAVTFIARGIYTNSKSVPGTDSSFSGFPKLAYNKFYFDEIYNALITKPLNALSVFTNKFIENRIIDGFVDDIKAITTRFSSSLRLVQQGKVDGYFFGMVAFIILIFLLKIL
jgi:NADH-quinone oxidoreductase subunit L